MLKKIAEFEKKEMKEMDKYFKDFHTKNKGKVRQMERYWITGVQLGLLMSIPKKKERQKVGNSIIDNQFIGNFETDEDKKRFEAQIEKIK